MFKHSKKYMDKHPELLGRKIELEKLDEHRKRHVSLHKALDELFADYISHHGNETEFLKMPLVKLIEWSYQQTINPTEDKIE